jgi:DNA gyrase subunit A
VRDLGEEGRFVFMVTSRGVVKKTALKAFSNPRTAGIIAIDLDKGDELLDTQLTSGADNILIATRDGMSIRFPEKDVRPMGRNARGVIGIRLEDKDLVVGMSLAKDENTVLSVCENGFGKRTLVSEYRVQHRGGQGIINIKATSRNGKVVAMLTVDDDDDIIVIATDGQVVRIPVSGLRAIGRNTQGVKVMTVDAEASVTSAARALADRKEEQVTESAPTETKTDVPPNGGAVAAPLDADIGEEDGAEE